MIDFLLAQNDATRARLKVIEYSFTCNSRSVTNTPQSADSRPASASEEMAAPGWGSDGKVIQNGENRWTEVKRWKVTNGKRVESLNARTVFNGEYFAYWNFPLRDVFKIEVSPMPAVAEDLQRSRQTLEAEDYVRWCFGEADAYNEQLRSQVDKWRRMQEPGQEGRRSVEASESQGPHGKTYRIQLSSLDPKSGWSNVITYTIDPEKGFAITHYNGTLSQGGQVLQTSEMDAVLVPLNDTFAPSKLALELKTHPDGAKGFRIHEQHHIELSKIILGKVPDKEQFALSALNFTPKNELVVTKKLGNIDRFVQRDGKFIPSDLEQTLHSPSTKPAKGEN